MGSAVSTATKGSTGPNPRLGVVALKEEAEEGCLGHAGSHEYEVERVVVKNVTVEELKAGKKVGTVRKAAKALAKTCSAVACEWEVGHAAEALNGLKVPSCASALLSLPTLFCGFGSDDKILIVAAGPGIEDRAKKLGIALDKAVVAVAPDPKEAHTAALTTPEKTKHAAHFTAYVEKVTELVQGHVKVDSTIKAVVLEAASYTADSVRKKTGLPVYEALTTADGLIAGRVDNPRFGEAFASSSSSDQLEEIRQAKIKAQTKIPRMAPDAPSLGVVRLDYDYPAAPGDIDHPGSHNCEVVYRAVPGLTFSMCQAGTMTAEVDAEFLEAVAWLEAKPNVKVLTADCGFFMWHQAKARTKTSLPVCMSALSMLPTLCAASTCKIAVFTANSQTLEPMRALIKEEAGVAPDDPRFVIVGCQDVPGFEAVANGDKVDVAKVTPGMVSKAKQVLAANPDVGLILLECTELPPYADALRRATGLPVYDAITTAEFFLSGYLDNPRVGIADWQKQFDGSFLVFSLLGLVTRVC